MKTLPLPPLKTSVQDIVRTASGETIVIDWTSLPGPQSLAYYSEADELFYGGQAGGGKTDLLLGLAATAHQYSIIFRREYPQLKGLIHRGKEIIGKKGRYNSTEKIWRIGDRRIIELGAVQYENDVEKFQGRAHDLKAFDELTHFTKQQYKFLTGWARTSDPNQRVRIVATGNPPTTAEGRWVIEYWAPWLDDKHPNPAVPGELRWFVVIDGEDTEVNGPEPIKHEGEILQPRSRTFIPASVDDNPYYAATGYKSVLQSLPEPLRSKLLYGDFKADIEDDPWQVIPTAWVEAAMERWTSSPPTAIRHCVGCDPARGGQDKTVFAIRHGQWIAPLLKWAGKETPDGPTVAKLLLPELRIKTTVNIDVVGIGGSVIDSLRQLEVSGAYGLSGGASSDKTDRTGRLGFANKRAEWYWGLREALDPDHGNNVQLPPDRELLADLTAPKWSLSGWKIKVEAKEDIKSRLGRSPDCGDAVVYAFAESRDHAEILRTGRSRSSTRLQGF